MMETMTAEVQPQFQNSVDVKLDYIQRDIRDIKGDINTIKNDFINRREFTEGLNALRAQIPNETDHEKRLRALEKGVWKFIGALAVSQIVILPVILFFFYRAIK